MLEIYGLWVKKGTMQNKNRDTEYNRTISSSDMHTQIYEQNKKL